MTSRLVCRRLHWIEEEGWKKISDILSHYVTFKMHYGIPFKNAFVNLLLFFMSFILEVNKSFFFLLKKTLIRYKMHNFFLHRIGFTSDTF